MNGKRLAQPAIEDIDLGRVLHALSDPMRLAVIVALAADDSGVERRCSSFGLPVSKATRTHHFRVLREAGLIEQHDVGNGRLTRLRREDLEARFPGLLEVILRHATV